MKIRFKAPTFTSRICSRNSSNERCRLAPRAVDVDCAHPWSTQNSGVCGGFDSLIQRQLLPLEFPVQAQMDIELVREMVVKLLAPMLVAETLAASDYSPAQSGKRTDLPCESCLCGSDHSSSDS
jgi:hypothetical protein